MPRRTRAADWRTGPCRTETCGAGGVGQSRAQQVGSGDRRRAAAAADGAARSRWGRATGGGRQRRRTEPRAAGGVGRLVAGDGGGGWSARVAKKQSEAESEDAVESRPVAFATPASCQHVGQCYGGSQNYVHVTLKQPTTVSGFKHGWFCKLRGLI